MLKNCDERRQGRIPPPLLSMPVYTVHCILQVYSGYGYGRQSTNVHTGILDSICVNSLQAGDV